MSGVYEKPFRRNIFLATSVFRIDNINVYICAVKTFFTFFSSSQLETPQLWHICLLLYTDSEECMFCNKYIIVAFWYSWSVDTSTIVVFDSLGLKNFRRSIPVFGRTFISFDVNTLHVISLYNESVANSYRRKVEFFQFSVSPYM